MIFNIQKKNEQSKTFFVNKISNAEIVLTSKTR